MLLGSLTQNIYSEETTTLDDFTVTARPIGLQSLEHIAQPVTILSDEALRKRQAQTIGETLSDIPGVTTNRFSPLASRPIIRGLGGSRVLMLENGIGSLDVSTISADHAVTVEPIQAEQIEIFRGPSTLLYGSQASGGLVNVVTNRIPEFVPEFENRINSSFNVNSLEKLFSIQTEGGYKKIAFHLDATKRDAKNYATKKGQIDNSFYDTQNFNIGTSYVDSWGFLGVAYGRFDSTHGVPLNPADPAELPFIDAQQDRIDLSGQINNPFAGIKAVTLQVGHNNYAHTEFETAGLPGTVFSNDQMDSRIEIQHEPMGMFSGVIGTQLGYRNISAVGDEAFLPKTKTKTAAVFILENVDISDSLQLEIGARFEHQEDKPGNASKVVNTMYSVSSGIHWDFLEDTSLGLTIGRSQRAPAAEELFASGPHVATATFELGQVGLDVETANSMDLSFRHQYRSGQLNLNLFVNYVEDFIFLKGLDRNNDSVVDKVDDSGIAAGDFLLVQFQQDNVIFYGFEAEIGINLYSGNNGQLDMNLFSDYVRAERENGDNLPRISPARFGTSLDYTFKEFNVGIDFTNILAQKDNAALETDTGGYSVLGLNANYDILAGEQSLNVFAKATNLLNEDGRLHTSFIKDRAPIMGRSLMVGFQLAF
jgi:iron complex outermembrane receptor protein